MLDLEKLLIELIALPAETETIEFKENYENSQGIGEYISALANSAIMLGKEKAFLVWGVSDETHEIVGTKFNYLQKGKGNEDLEPWLRRGLDPEIFFEFKSFIYLNKHIVILIIDTQVSSPVRFWGEAYIRSGSHTKKLKSVPSYERKIWEMLNGIRFETGLASDPMNAESILECLDWSAYFSLTNQPVPPSVRGKISCLVKDNLVKFLYVDQYQITNLGAILFARDLNDFTKINRKAIRLITYFGKDKSAEASEMNGPAPGYAAAFVGVVNLTVSVLPSSEKYVDGIRQNVPSLPQKAVRELIANALIHQDFNISGSGPIIEVYKDRIEITNPGKPLMDPSRFIDTAPQSRNEILASFMRRIGICEERGSGWDQIAALVESRELPAPIIETSELFTRVVLFEHRPFSALSKEEKVNSTFFHACLQYVRRARMTNSSLRERFKLPISQKSVISRLIRDAVADGKIVPYDASVGDKSLSYVPFWADHIV